MKITNLFRRPAKNNHYRRESSKRQISPNLPVDYRGSLASEAGSARHAIYSVLSGFFYTFLMLLTAIILLWFCRQMANEQKFTIHKIHFIAPVKHIRVEDLQYISLPFAGKNFFSADIASLKKRLNHLPWVYQVSVSRVWPDRLSVQIKEQVPVARWRGNQLINQDLDIFSVPYGTLPKNLPEFKGSTGQVRVIWQNYQSIEKILLPIGLHAAFVELSNRQSWQLTLDNGLTLILGRSDGLDHLKRFVEVYNQVLATNSMGAIDYIDLRYSNGMAVKPHK